jgi:hypothetical protein
MPKINDFEKQAAKKKDSNVTDPANIKNKKPRRRPGREDVDATSEAFEAISDEGLHAEHTRGPAAAQTQEVPMEPVDIAEESVSPAHDMNEKDSKIHLEFFGSEIIRAKAPKAFELAETVADEWVKDGRFEALPVGHPLAQFAAQVGLRKAKDIEKKLDEKGVFQLAKVGLMYAKSILPRR